MIIVVALISCFIDLKLSSVSKIMREDSTCSLPAEEPLKYCKSPLQKKHVTPSLGGCGGERQSEGLAPLSLAFVQHAHQFVRLKGQELSSMVPQKTIAQ